ncbi:MAG: c-type cytochrome [Lentisphaeraceae bacterium]|nr:c-type cytochrome [Lentisphaeraceae bacterium]
MRNLTFLTSLLLSAVSIFAQRGDRKGHNMEDVIPKDKIPASPPLDPQKSLKTIKVQEGFTMELVAGEQQVFNPVTMVFDGNGRMWVCEMTSYMPNVDGKNEEVPEGNISILEDSDGDGVVDKRIEFLSDIILPRTVTFVQGGILYADHTSLYFAEVLPGDKVGIREMVDKDYAKGGGLEHKPNTMLYGLDGWYYNSKSDKRYKAIPLDMEAPIGSTEIYKNKYFKLVKGVSEYRGQWGLSMDDYGRLYHNGNSSPAQGEYLRPSSLQRNPGFKTKVKAHNIGKGDVYPIRMNPGVNRGYMKGTLRNITDPNNSGYGKLARFTAASGNTVYRGTNFPENFYGASFVPEPSGNLISVRNIKEKESYLYGTEVFKNSEIVASTDERFRPVNLYTAPDGTLYILDLYHGILQHRVYVTTYLRNQILARGLDKHNNDKGRIYRLKYKSGKLDKAPKMEGMSSEKLVPYLAHANGWWRDTARRLIVQRNDKSVVSAIESLISSSTDYKAQINALWTLEGLNSVSLSAVQAGLKSSNQKVKVNAISVSERLPVKDHAAMADILESIQNGADYELTLQLALTAGIIKSEKSLSILKTILTSKFLNKPYIREAVISGLYGREKALEELLGSSFKDKKFLGLLKKVGKEIKVATNFSKLNKEGQALFKAGEELFFGKATCFACHGPDAEGMPNIGPPLVKSEWVNGSKEKLVSVLLHGLQGPIKVKGKTYNPPLPMPGLGANPMFKDADIAAISTFIRNHFGNKASVISAKDVAEIRKKTDDRSAPFTAKELEGK